MTETNGEEFYEAVEWEGPSPSSGSSVDAFRNTIKKMMGVLSNDRTMGIRNKKTIGTRKHNSEANKSARHADNSDGPRNIQGTSPSMSGIGDTLSNQPDGRAVYRDDVAQKVEPRSYRSVLLNG